jgi:hypothetical protein
MPLPPRWYLPFMFQIMIHIYHSTTCAMCLTHLSRLEIVILALLDECKLWGMLICHIFQTSVTSPPLVPTYTSAISLSLTRIAKNGQASPGPQPSWIWTAPPPPQLQVKIQAPLNDK